MSLEKNNYKFVGNKALGRISKRFLQENKALQIFAFECQTSFEYLLTFLRFALLPYCRRITNGFLAIFQCLNIVLDWKYVL